MLVLGLDMSSTTIGYATSDGAVIDHHDLRGDIAERCMQAAAHVAALLDAYQPALVVIEAPVARFASAVIPQARVSGAVLGVLAQRQALWAEVSPSDMKKQFTGTGAATKELMLITAAFHLEIEGKPATVKNKAVLTNDTGIVLTEDEADAYALALAGAALRVVVVADGVAA